MIKYTASAWSWSSKDLLVCIEGITGFELLNVKIAA